MNRAVFSRPGRARVAGVDEAGRGPLAGPVVAAAVILPEDHGIAGIDDSKKLTAEDREALAVRIDERAIAVSVASASVEEIDRLNILWASLLAMKRAVEGLSTTPEHVLVDGNRAPQLSQTTEAIVRGDQTETVIAAASIIAKVRRDAIMAALHQDFPFYGWDRNKGYPTREHKQELMRMGACRHHRTSFAPVRAALAITAGSVSGAPV